MWTRPQTNCLSYVPQVEERINYLANKRNEIVSIFTKLSLREAVDIAPTQKGLAWQANVPVNIILKHKFLILLSKEPKIRKLAKALFEKKRNVALVYFESRIT